MGSTLHDRFVEEEDANRRTLRTLRGSGPAPTGWVVCWRTECPARRDPFTGRFTRRAGHYHPRPD